MRSAAVESATGMGLPSAVEWIREVEEAFVWKSGKASGMEWRRRWGLVWDWDWDWVWARVCGDVGGGVVGSDCGAGVSSGGSPAERIFGEEDGRGGVWR